MEDFKLNDLLHLTEDEIKEYKLHLASVSYGTQPLDVFARDFDEWVDWNRYRDGRDDFSRRFIFSLITDYNKANTYIFGGIFEVVERHNDHYDIKLCEKLKPLIGRLRIYFERYQGMRLRAYYFESYIEDLIVQEILEKPYAGIPFPGFDNVRLDFTMLEILVKHDKSDWKDNLKEQKGIYVILDKSNGKKYIGSAYGDNGIWSRWCCYAGTAHGGNDELVELIEKEGVEYARENFQLSILEIWPKRTDNETIINRENHWKEVLLSRGDFGYNRN